VGALLTGAALRVDHRTGGVLGQPRVQPGPPDHPVGLLAGLSDDTADDLLDEIRVDSGALEHLTLRETEESGGVHAGEPALPLAEWGADGIDDHGGAHGAKLEHVLVVHKQACITPEIAEKRTRNPFPRFREYVVSG